MIRLADSKRNIKFCPNLKLPNLNLEKFHSNEKICSYLVLVLNHVSLLCQFAEQEKCYTDLCCNEVICKKRTRSTS